MVTITGYADKDCNCSIINQSVFVPVTTNGANGCEGSVDIPNFLDCGGALTDVVYRWQLLCDENGSTLTGGIDIPQTLADTLQVVLNFPPGIPCSALAGSGNTGTNIGGPDFKCDPVLAIVTLTPVF
jgi:hypothetical protein